ncbi:MAG: sugar ABC transporter permease [Clostridia bacterium]|nr:sugar ABC transporter permease [Clostridia bacterium]
MQKVNNTKRRFDTEKLPLVIMLLPFAVLFFGFTVLPIISSVVLSFFNYDMIHQLSFAGLDNYMTMLLEDDVFWICVKNTVMFAVITGPVGFLLSFVLAWMINELNRGMRTVLSFLFYSPALMGNVYFIWEVFFSGDSYGYANSLLQSLGLIVEPILWFKSAQYAFTLVVIIQLWCSMGVSFLANISGLQNVNEELYEAGAIDGIRNRWAELWYITLPSMKEIILFSCVMQIQSAFSISGIVSQLCGYPSVNYSVDTLVSLLTDIGGTRYEMGLAAAMSVFLFAVMAFTRVGIGKLVSTLGK